MSVPWQVLWNDLRGGSTAIDPYEGEGCAVLSFVFYSVVKVLRTRGGVRKSQKESGTWPWKIRDRVVFLGGERGGAAGDRLGVNPKASFAKPWRAGVVL